MSSLILALLGFGVAFAFIGSGDDDDTIVSDPPGEDDPPTPPSDDPADIIHVSDGLSDDGSDGDDVFLLSSTTVGSFSANLSGGDGDDSFRLSNLERSVAMVSGSVDGGAGADFIEVLGFLTDVAGGAGNDTISAQLNGGSVNGNAGDDQIRVVAGNSDAVLVNGGEGNDTINGTGSQNIVMTGGAGDDLIVSDGVAQGGTGYALVSEGGAGNDTLAHSVDVFPFTEFDSPAILRGGEGTDRFIITLTTSTGFYEPAPDDPEVFITAAGVLDDFDADTDSLDIDLGMIDSFYTDVSATMVEDTESGSTEIILSLSGETLPDQDVVIRVNATGLTWDDMTFLGATPSNLNTV